MRNIRAMPIGGRPRSPFVWYGSIIPQSLARGTTLSLSPRKRSRRVTFFLPAYSACAKLIGCFIPSHSTPPPTVD